MDGSFDASVVGLGAMGSVTLYQLARRGIHALGIEMFEPGHDQGSSHGFHRMIRMSSSQDDGYAPLAERAFDLWREAEDRAGSLLLRSPHHHHRSLGRGAARRARAADAGGTARQRLLSADAARVVVGRARGARFLLDVPEGSFYGMPAVGDVGVKIGLSAGEATTARTIRRTIDDAEIASLHDVLDRYLPGASGPEQRRISCICTYTVDRDFVIDRHPDHGSVLFGCGFSGRGYKFAPVVGEILADLAIGGRPSHDIAFLRAERFAKVTGVE